MPEQSITIKFKPIGDKSLINSINKLDAATKRLTGENRQLKHELSKTTKNAGVLDTRNKRLTNTNKDLGLSFATLRSKMLLFNFAMALGIRQVIDFGRQAAAVNLMRQSFNSLIDPTEKSSESLNKLRQATNGTVSDFRLLQQANNAMILGVSKNTDEMAEMFDMAQRLGKALGRDTASSVESLITGVGRQSRLMLDNIGIIVKVDDAQKEYAMSLNKSVSALTDNEKKQAFQNAVMDAARKKVELLGDEQASTTETFDRFAATSQNAAMALGDFANIFLEPTLDLMSSFNETITPQNVRIFASAFTVSLIPAVILYNNKIKVATFLTKTFGITLMKNPYIATTVAVTTLATGVLKLVDAFEDANDVTDNISGKTATYIESLKKLTTSQLNVEKGSQNASIVRAKDTEEYKKATKAIKDANEMIEIYQNKLDKTIQFGGENADETDKQIKNYTDLITSYKEARDGVDGYGSAIIKQINASKLSIEEIDKFISILGDSDSTIENHISVNEQLNQLFLKTREGRISDIEGMIEFVNTNADLIDSDEKRVAVLKMLEEQLNKTKEVDNQAHQAKLKTVSASVGALAKLNQASSGSAKATARLMQVQAGIDAYAAANRALATGVPPMSYIQAATSYALGLANVIQIEKSIGKFEHGGMIGGRRHSQGGTIIEAEQGEFVMSRNAVDAVGIETMNRINQTGSAGVTVNISGNVMSQDFVEGELAERIKEAVRKGSNFGMS